MLLLNKKSYSVNSTYSWLTECSSVALQWHRCHGCVNLFQQLEREKEENKKMQQQLEQKDRRIAELERQIAMLNKVSSPGILSYLFF